MNGFRIIEHQRLCPDCASTHVSAQELTNADGTTETALICGDCGAAWPMACITEHLEPAPPPTSTQPHLVLRIDACGPGTEAARRWYWCPACDTYLHGDELAKTPVLHFTPGPHRRITRADLQHSATTRTRW